MVEDSLEADGEGDADEAKEKKAPFSFRLVASFQSPAGTRCTSLSAAPFGGKIVAKEPALPSKKKTQQGQTPCVSPEKRIRGTGQTPGSIPFLVRQKRREAVHEDGHEIFGFLVFILARVKNLHEFVVIFLVDVVLNIQVVKWFCL